MQKIYKKISSASQGQLIYTAVLCLSVQYPHKFMMSQNCLLVIYKKIWDEYFRLKRWDYIFCIQIIYTSHFSALLYKCKQTEKNLGWKIHRSEELTFLSELFFYLTNSFSSVNKILNNIQNVCLNKDFFLLRIIFVNQIFDEENL